MELQGKNLHFVAEIGNNHNGCFDTAIELVDRAIEAGADAVKFQLRDMLSLYRDVSEEDDAEDLGVEYILDLLAKYQLTDSEHLDLYNYCKRSKIGYICTPWDQASAIKLKDMGVRTIKIASADLTNLPLIDYCCSFASSIILSTGMSEQWEIEKVASFLSEKTIPWVFLHSNSTYPSPFDELNLCYIENLDRLAPRVGYSGHERGFAPTLAAIALGASVIERHITLDKEMEGPDHKASLLPEEFAQMVLMGRQIEESLGSKSEVRSLSQGERMNRENLSKSLVASKNIEKGQKLAFHSVEIKSPGRGLSPLRLEELVGRIAGRDLVKGDFFYESDLSDEQIDLTFSFDRPWGIPVRYHDANQLVEKFKPSFIEFHLSYRDMDLNPEHYLRPHMVDFFAVHAPELFEESRLLDLASPDEDYRYWSIRKLQEVVDLTKKLHFIAEFDSDPVIIVNVGGFSTDAFIPSDRKEFYYERLVESFNSISCEGVNLCPQTNAPFPWHFGGQRYQNLLLQSDEIVQFCEVSKLNLCLDLSHSALSANHFGFDLCDFVSRISPYVSHIHLSDFEGVHGEGLPLGDGQMDLAKTIDLLNSRLAGVPFIPEIWQGHKDLGRGFADALSLLTGRL